MHSHAIEFRNAADDPDLTQLCVFNVMRHFIN